MTNNNIFDQELYNTCNERLMNYLVDYELNVNRYNRNKVNLFGNIHITKVSDNRYEVYEELFAYTKRCIDEKLVKSEFVGSYDEIAPNIEDYGFEIYRD